MVFRRLRGYGFATLALSLLLCNPVHGHQDVASRRKTLEERKSTRVQSSLVQADSMAQCSIIGDPHVKTFNEGTYGMHAAGPFHLARWGSESDAVDICIHSVENAPGKMINPNEKVYVVKSVAYKCGSTVMVVQRPTDTMACAQNNGHVYYFQMAEDEYVQIPESSDDPTGDFDDSCPTPDGGMLPSSTYQINCGCASDFYEEEDVELQIRFKKTFGTVDSLSVAITSKNIETDRFGLCQSVSYDGFMGKADTCSAIDYPTDHTSWAPEFEMDECGYCQYLVTKGFYASFDIASSGLCLETCPFGEEDLCSGTTPPADSGSSGGDDSGSSGGDDSGSSGGDDSGSSGGDDSGSGSGDDNGSEGGDDSGSDGGDDDSKDDSGGDDDSKDDSGSDDGDQTGPADDGNGDNDNDGSAGGNNGGDDTDSSNGANRDFSEAKDPFIHFLETLWCDIEKFFGVDCEIN